MPDDPKTTERSPASRVFLELAVRFHNAAREQDQPRMDALMKLINELEAEFPAETADEKEFAPWQLKLPR